MSNITKKDLHELIERMPEDFSLEDLQYRLFVLQKLENAENQLKHGSITSSFEEMRELAKKWRGENKERYSKYRRKSLRKTRYGVSSADYDEMFKRQKGLCAICGLKEKTIRGGKLLPIGIDHNHQTNKVRGLLCQSCNRAIGLLKVDNFGILNLQMAIEYLKNHG